MSEQPPSIGRIVTYRNTRGVDMPAIITGLIPGAVDVDGAAHLYLFVPPGEQPDTLSYEYGTPYSADPAPASWRWPDRAAVGK